MHCFFPGQAVAIDKGLVAGKVHNPIRRYLSNKHHAMFEGKSGWFLIVILPLFKNAMFTDE